MKQRYFEDRDSAGRLLADHLARLGDQECHVVAIPLGGVTVAVPIAKTLKAPLSVIFMARLPVPWNQDTGFGAVTSTGEVLVDEKLVASLSLSADRVRAITMSKLRELKRREENYRPVNPPLKVAGRTVVLVSDGLPSGFTMLPALSSLRTKKPASVVVATPCASQEAMDRIAPPKCDEVVALIVKKSGRFSTADCYEHYHDVSDEDIVQMLKTANEGFLG